jgi:hypothetical protein
MNEKRKGKNRGGKSERSPRRDGKSERSPRGETIVSGDGKFSQDERRFAKMKGGFLCKEAVRDR